MSEAREYSNTLKFDVVCSLTVGGGYGWLSGSHGLVIDNTVQVRKPSNIPPLSN